MRARQAEAAVQGVRGRRHMRTRQAEEHVQGVRGLRHMRARQGEEHVQGVRGGRHMRARQAEEHVEAQMQAVRGYQGWLREAAALGTAACNGNQEPPCGSIRGATCGLAD